jgi:hypothetical protein
VTIDPNLSSCYRVEPDDPLNEDTGQSITRQASSQPEMTTTPKEIYWGGLDACQTGANMDMLVDNEDNVTSTGIATIQLITGRPVAPAVPEDGFRDNCKFSITHFESIIFSRS